MKKKNKVKVIVVTGSRAEYGLLYWLMKGLQEDKAFDLRVLVTGMHLSPDFGLTYRQIEKDGFRIDKKVEMLLSSDTETGISKSIGIGQIGFTDALAEMKPDLLLLLGDRFEIFSAATAASVLKIPIVHFHGGETTEGAFDEAFRHSITKMSHIHFTATEEYRKRVIQMGEQPAHVHNVGALGIENINRLKLLDRKAFEKSIHFKLGKLNVLVTFHSVTLEKNTAEQQFRSLLRALDELKNTHIIFTKPNADTDGRIIIKMIDEYVEKNRTKAIDFVSLGQLNYLSALKHVDVVVGNSSSGLIEAPSFKIPTINIGDRQKGRTKAASVLDCDPTYNSIKAAIHKAFSSDFKINLKKIQNPYGNSNASTTIIRILKNTDLDGILKKSFYNL